MLNLLTKIILMLGLIFFSTFIIIKLSGVLTVEDIKMWFENIKTQPSYVIGGLVVLLLFIDLFIAIPTMTTILLAGYFLGFGLGAMYAFLGLFMASFTGYFLSLAYGKKVLNLVSKDKEQKQQMQDTFAKHGMTMIVLSRAMPMLPEISCTLAGTCKMPLGKFTLAWPYLLIIAYAGSISDANNPKPAIFAVLWLSWFYFMKKSKKNSFL